MKLEERSIILFRGETQYGVLNRFIDDIADAYRSIGLTANVIALGRNFEETRSQLIETLGNEKPLFALGLNGAGQFNINQKSIYDIGEFHHVSWLVDHPVYHMDRMETFPKTFGIVTIIDQQHEAFINAAAPNTPNTAFLPLGGCLAKDTAKYDRDIDILFCGTGVSCENLRKNWEQSNQEDLQYLEAGIEIGKANSQVPTMEIVSQVFNSFKLPPDRERFLRLTLNIEQFQRAHHRNSLLMELDNAQISVDIFGNNWDWCAFDHHKVHESVNFDSTLNLYKRSKIGLNISNFFTHGSHDRIFTSMLNGAVSLTNGSNYLDTLEGFEESAVTFAQEKPIAEITRELLSVPKNEFDSLAKQGEEYALANHTFEHRAIALRDALLSSF